MTLYSPYFMGKKILIMKILCCALFILFSATSVVAQKFTKSEVKDLFLAAISYHAVARVCGEASSIEISKKVIRRVLNFGEGHNLLSAEAIYYQRYPEEVIAKGEAQYRKDRYVGCSQAREIINQLDEATKRLP